MKKITALIFSVALASVLSVPAIAEQPTKTAQSDKGGATEQQCLAHQAKEYEACKANCAKLPDQKSCDVRCDKRDKDAKLLCKKPQV
ncbi:MAG TPA: hypothetical protein VKR38_07245 [Usitatibacter sp.]|nr:hypothetical protein [Usitatibacter sp.]